MAPTRSKKRKSTESTNSADVQNFPAPPQLVPTKQESSVKTPVRSPSKKVSMGITLGQKQALIDNLQLEITERARMLRAQYALQAQGLRTRIEIRVNRIPISLRRAKVGDLLAKYSEQAPQSTTATSKALQPLPKMSSAKIQSQPNMRSDKQSASPKRGTKRMSDEMTGDKENEELEGPKKRQRGPPMVPARTNSKMQEAQVLSPRSANSRQLPRSPIHHSPQKPQLARPISPLKPTAPTTIGGATSILTNMVEKAKSTRGGTAARKVTAQSQATTGVGRGKKTGPPQVVPRMGRWRAASTSESSDMSTGTTIVRKPVPAPAKKAPAKKTMMSTIKGMGGGQKKAAPAAPAATGGRILRKRG